MLSLLNGLANAMLRLVRVHPQDQLAQVHGPDELRILLEQSREHGLLGAEQHQLLTSMLELQGTTVAQVMEPFDQIVTVRRDDPAERIEEVSRDSGRSRLAVLDSGGEVCGLVHVREAVRRHHAGRPATADELMSAAFTLPATASVTEAVAAMRAGRRSWRWSATVAGRPARSASSRWRTCWRRSSASSTTRPTRCPGAAGCADRRDVPDRPRRPRRSGRTVRPPPGMPCRHAEGHGRADMRLTGVSRDSAWTGLSVRTTLPNPSTRPGLRLPGRVTLTAVRDDVPVRHIRLGLVTQVEPEDPGAPRRLVQFHQVSDRGPRSWCRPGGGGRSTSRCRCPGRPR